MITEQGPKVIEFNCRFGDPETQVVLPRLASDLSEIFLSVVKGELAAQPIEWKEDAALCVVMASGGYPGSYEKGKPIHGLPDDRDDVIVFHAGTKRENGEVVTNGGRVLGLTALGKDLREAQRKAYDEIQHIRFEDAHYRKDIGSKAIQEMR